MKAGIIAQAFGVPYTINSNMIISQIASQMARELNATVYTQLDILVQPGVSVVYTKEQPGNPPPTLEIARGAVEWAIQNKVEILWIAAAKPHLWRCTRDLKRAVKEAGARIKTRVCPEINEHSTDNWYCKNSAQRRTCSRLNWWSRELVLMLMPFFVYKRVVHYLYKG